MLEENEQLQMMYDISKVLVMLPPEDFELGIQYIEELAGPAPRIESVQRYINYLRSYWLPREFD